MCPWNKIKITVVGSIISHFKTASKVSDDCFEHDKDGIEFIEPEQWMLQKARRFLPRVFDLLKAVLAFVSPAPPSFASP